MFNLQPGQKLSEMALGLGKGISIPYIPPVIPEDTGGGWAAYWKDNPEFTYEDYLRDSALRDDEELVGIVANILLSGVL